MELWLSECNKFLERIRWSHKDDIVVYDTNSILSRINKTITPTNNRGDYKMHAYDYDLANEMMKHNIEKQ